MIRVAQVSRRWVLGGRLLAASGNLNLIQKVL